jgi:hypothetical protein
VRKRKIQARIPPAWALSVLRERIAELNVSVIVQARFAGWIEPVALWRRGRYIFRRSSHRRYNHHQQHRSAKSGRYHGAEQVLVLFRLASQSQSHISWTDKDVFTAPHNLLQGKTQVRSHSGWRHSHILSALRWLSGQGEASHRTFNSEKRRIRSRMWAHSYRYRFRLLTSK